MKMIFLNPKIKEVRKHFDFLFDRGYTILATRYDFWVFGNWIVSLDSKDCIIEIISDREEINLMFTSKTIDSISVEIRAIIYYLSNRQKFIGRIKGDEKNQLRIFANLLREYLDIITPYFSKDLNKYKNDLKSSQEIYNRRLMP